MSDALRERIAGEVEDARTLFVVYEDENGNWGKCRDTNLDGYEAISSCLMAAITAREYSRDFLDDVDADDPELRQTAEEVYAQNVGGDGGRR